MNLLPVKWTEDLPLLLPPLCFVCYSAVNKARNCMWQGFLVKEDSFVKLGEPMLKEAIFWLKAEYLIKASVFLFWSVKHRRISFLICQHPSSCQGLAVVDLLQPMWMYNCVGWSLNLLNAGRNLGTMCLRAIEEEKGKDKPSRWDALFNSSLLLWALSP